MITREEFNKNRDEWIDNNCYGRHEMSLARQCFDACADILLADPVREQNEPDQIKADLVTAREQITALQAELGNTRGAYALDVIDLNNKIQQLEKENKELKSILSGKTFDDAQAEKIQRLEKQYNDLHLNSCEEIQQLEKENAELKEVYKRMESICNSRGNEIQQQQAIIEKLKSLILLVDPVVSNEVMNDIALRQWGEFIRCFPQETADRDYEAVVEQMKVGENA